jgi:triacylglycerol esterase/lipase EstA (alpha/beta hydrolase family)
LTEPVGGKKTMNQLVTPSIVTIAKESLTPFEFTRLFISSPVLALQSRGNGEPVIVMPGLGASNSSTFLLRRYLSWLGYNVEGWELGRNSGDVKALLPQVAGHVQQVNKTTGLKVNLVGWSLGGVLAREVARDNPAMVRQVITLGSPVVGGPKYTVFGNLYRQRGVDVDAIEATVAGRESNPIRVPVTSIYSKNDGIVGWQASIDRLSPQVDNIEVCTTHLGMGISPDVFKILARKLA